MDGGVLSRNSCSNWTKINFYFYSFSIIKTHILSGSQNLNMQQKVIFARPNSATRTNTCFE